MSALTEVIEVLEHLVATHSNWNMTLSKDEAIAKLAAAKVAAVVGAGGVVLEDAGEAAVDASKGDVQPTMADVEKLLVDAAELKRVIEGQK